MIVSSIIDGNWIAHGSPILWLYLQQAHRSVLLELLELDVHVVRISKNVNFDVLIGSWATNAIASFVKDWFFDERTTASWCLPRRTCRDLPCRREVASCTQSAFFRARYCNGQAKQWMPPLLLHVIILHLIIEAWMHHGFKVWHKWVLLWF